MIAYSVTSAANERSINALTASEQTVDLALQSLDGVVEVVSQSPSLAGIGIGDSFQDDSLLPNAAMEPTPGSAKILERVQPIYERLSRQSPTRPDIVLQMIDASVQLARVQHSLGRTTDGIETLERSLDVLDTRASSAKVTTHDRHLQTARLNNELGGLHAFEFDGTQAQQCFRWAIESAKQQAGFCLPAFMIVLLG